MAGPATSIDFGFAKLLADDGSSYFLRKYEISIGRWSKTGGADVILGKNMNMSRDHAHVAYNFAARCFELKVLGKNGATVNGTAYTPTSAPQPLQSRDHLTFGDRSYHFLLPAATTPQLPPSKRQRTNPGTLSADRGGASVQAHWTAHAAAGGTGVTDCAAAGSSGGGSFGGSRGGNDGGAAGVSEGTSERQGVHAGATVNGGLHELHGACANAHAASRPAAAGPAADVSAEPTAAPPTPPHLDLAPSTAEVAPPAVAPHAGSHPADLPASSAAAPAMHSRLCSPAPGLVASPAADVSAAEAAAAEAAGAAVPLVASAEAVPHPVCSSGGALGGSSMPAGLQAGEACAAEGAPRAACDPMSPRAAHVRSEVAASASLQSAPVAHAPAAAQAAACEAQAGEHHESCSKGSGSAGHVESSKAAMPGVVPVKPEVSPHAQAAAMHLQSHHPSPLPSTEAATQQPVAWAQLGLH